MDEESQKIVRVAIYGPLDTATKQIRLLRLEPGSGDDPLRCSFIKADLASETPPEYETISYVWGDANIRDSILLDGHTLEVPSSSGAALRRVRLAEAVRTLWIDAVCINQADVTERSQQVILMGDIYSSGLVNLVQFTEHCEEAARTLDKIVEIEKLTSHVVGFNEDDTILPHDYLQNNVEPAVWLKLVKDFEVWQCVFVHEWFIRIWVIQEAVLAKRNNLCWGSFEMNMDVVFRLSSPAMLILQDYIVGHRQPRNEVSGTAQRGSLAAKVIQVARCSNRGDAQPRRVLALTMHGVVAGDCADVRDKVFGISGLISRQYNMPPNLWRLFKPDYTKPEHEVLTNGLRASLMDSDLYKLCYQDGTWASRVTCPELKGAPSWVTCWYAFKPWPPGVVEPPVGLELLYRACGSFSKCNKDLILSTCEEDLDTLELEGLSVGHVSQLSSTLIMHFSKSPNQRAYAFECWLREVFKMASETNRQLQVAVADVLIAEAPRSAEQDVSPTSARSYGAHGACLYWLWQRVGEGPADDILSGCETPSNDALVDYIRRAAEMCDRRCFFVFDERYGIGPPAMLPGDTIAIFAGGKTPFVIRERPGELGYYTFIGPCYIYGFMDGEAVKDYEEVGKLPQVFKLR